MYKLSVRGLAAGQRVQIDGIGAFKNGVYELDEKQALRFSAAISGYHPEEKVPTLLEAFDGHPHITVTKVEPKKDKQTEGGDK